MSHHLDTVAALLVDALREVERLRIDVEGEQLPLGDRAALVLLAYPQGLGCEPLARRLGVRTFDLREVLHADPRFAQSGSTRYRRWTVAAVESGQEGRDDLRDGWDGSAGPDPGNFTTDDEHGPEKAGEARAT